MQHIVLVGRYVLSFPATNSRFSQALLEPGLFPGWVQPVPALGSEGPAGRGEWHAWLCLPSLPPLLWAPCCLKHSPALGLSRHTRGVLGLVPQTNRAHKASHIMRCPLPCPARGRRTVLLGMSDEQFLRDVQKDVSTEQGALCLPHIQPSQDTIVCPYQGYTFLYLSQGMECAMWSPAEVCLVHILYSCEVQE